MSSSSLGRLACGEESSLASSRSDQGYSLLGGGEESSLASPLTVKWHEASLDCDVARSLKWHEAFLDCEVARSLKWHEASLDCEVARSLPGLMVPDPILMIFDCFWAQFWLLFAFAHLSAITFFAVVFGFLFD